MQMRLLKSYRENVKKKRKVSKMDPLISTPSCTLSSVQYNAYVAA